MVIMRAMSRVSRCAVAVSLLIFLRPAVSPSQDTHSLTAAAHPGLPDPPKQETDRFGLSPNARQAAQILGIEDLIRRLSVLTSTKDRKATRVMSVEELSLRQQITDAVIVACLDVEDVLDRIDYERAQIVELRDILRSRRDRAVGTTSLATLALSTGLGAVSGLLQFSESTKGLGDKIGVGAGGLSTLLSFHSIRQQHSGQRPSWVLPNMLTPFLDDAQAEGSRYPDDVWAYLKSVPPVEGPQVSRKDRLMAEWREAARLGPLDSSQAKSKIALLVGTDAAEKNLKLDLLSERGAMLADVRDAVSLMKRDLRDLLGEIRVSQ